MARRDSDFDLEGVEEEDTNLVDKLNNLVRPFINVLIELHTVSPEHMPQAEAVHVQIRGFLEDIIKRARSLKLPEEDIRDLRYALVAFADELMQLESGRFRDFWSSHLLQVEQFDEALAGEGFFRKLKQLRGDPRRFPILYVYYLCMLFGFRGEYRGRDELAFDNLLKDLQNEVERRILGSAKAKLAPRGYRPDDPGADTRRNLLIQTLAIVAAVIALFWYAGLYLVISDEAEDLRIELENKSKGRPYFNN